MEIAELVEIMPSVSLGADAVEDHPESHTDLFGILRAADQIEQTELVDVHGVIVPLRQLQEALGEVDQIHVIDMNQFGAFESVSLGADVLQNILEVERTILGVRLALAGI